MLPRPLLPPSANKGGKPSLEAFSLGKNVAKAAYIPESLFLSLRDKLNEPALLEGLKASASQDQGKLRPGHLFHNRIDRNSGRTPESGGLFAENIKWPEENQRFQVFAAVDPDCRKRMESLLAFIGQSGFGANASTGRGSFSFEIKEETELFAGAGNRAMSLSHGVITPEMQSPRYKLHTHYGKLGGNFATGGRSPFKYPVLMAKPGATFGPGGNPPFGKLLDGVHHDDNLSFIRHHALHLPIYFTEVAP
ncbi:MAG: type III-A CRISPR-associated RAMP protein Csm4, partial [Thermodesulfobacteriota bacterium]